MINKIIYSIHRILGTLLSVLFLMWFLTGIVMIYHGFPSANREEKLAKLSPLPTDSLPDVAEIMAKVEHPDSLTGLKLSNYLGHTTFAVSAGMKQEALALDTTQAEIKVDGDYIRNVAALWCDAPVAHVDTLTKLEQWIPFGRLKDDLPIYKFHFADDEQTQLYISSVTGEVLQCTNHSERVWAWFGAIPHWVYFTWLRQDVDLWKNVIIWISILGIFMLFAGFYISIRDYRRQVKRGKGLRSPYKKFWYRWHHVAGTIFGIFLLTWIFSGMMSLADTPEWLGREHKQYNYRELMDKTAPDLAQYPLDYRTVLKHFKGKATQIEWTHYFNMPTYTVQIENEKPLVVDATGSEVKALKLNEEQVAAAVKAIHGDENFTISEMSDYDNYYIDRKHELSLPVWKVAVDNADKTCYYVDPSTGNTRSFNTHSRWAFHMYQGFHSLRYKFLTERPVLWTIVMWTLLLAGAFVSLTGVVLGVRYLVRTVRKIKLLK